MAINIELEKIYFEDLDKREVLDSFDSEALRNMEKITEENIKRVKEIIKGPEFDKSEIWNLHYVAYILQHSQNIEDIRLAHEFADRAVKLGSSVTKWLFAATLDRYLLSIGKPQKFGTQYKLVNGKWKTQPVDALTSDEERIEYGVKPLKEYLKSKYK